jgi:hypothetical protein
MPAQDVWEQVRDAVADAVEALALRDPATDTPLPVYRALWAHDTGLSYPCIQVAADEGEPEIDEVAFGAEEVVYPVVILFKVAGEAGLTDQQAAFYQGVFRDLQNRFRSQLLATAPTVWRVRLRVPRALDRTRERWQRVGHAIQVFCASCEPAAGLPA